MTGGLNARRCAELARMVDGTPAFMDGVCLVQLLRADLNPTILGARTRSPLVLPVFFSIEASGDMSRALNLGESVLRQEEANTVMKVLREFEIIVTALHNHWLFEEPRLMYMHWEARMDPERFLRASLTALRAAGVRTRPLAGDDGGGRHQMDCDDDGHHGGDGFQMDDHRRESHHQECHECDGHHKEKGHDGRRGWDCGCPSCTKWRHHRPTHQCCE